MASTDDLRARVAELEAQQARMQALLNAIPDLMFRFNRDGMYLDYKADHSQMYTHDPQIIGKRLHDHFPPAFADMVMGHIHETLATGEMQTFEYSLPAPDGLAYFEARMIPSGADEVFALIRDITENKRAEMQLRESQQMLQTVLNAVPARVFWKDQDLRYLGCNQLFAEDAGLPSPDALIGKSDYEMVWAEQAALYQADDRRVMESGTPKINYEEPQSGPDGKQIWLQTSKIPLRDVTGAIIGMLGVYRDITDSKRAENEVRESQQMLQTVLNAVPARVFWKDRDLTYLGCNQLFAEDAGLPSPDALTGKSDYEMVWAEQAALYQADDRQVMESGTPKINYEEPQSGPDGKQIWLQTSKIPLRDTNGDIFGVLGVYSDVTERKQAEEKLAAERNLLHTLIDSLPDYVYVKDTDSHFLVVNTALARHLGYDSAEVLVGKTDFDVYPPNLAKQFDQDERKLIASGRSLLNHEEKNDTTSGQVQWVSTTKVPLRDPNGNITGLVGISRNVTERRQVEEALLQQRELLQRAVDLLPGLVFVKNMDGKFLLANRALADAYGTTADNLIGKSDFDFNPNTEEVESYLQADRKVILSGEMLFIPEEQITLASGEVRWLQTMKSPLLNHDGSCDQLMGVCIDITERKQAEAERERLQQQVIDAQRQALQELSTPIIPILEGIIVMPLIGSIDSLRAGDIMRSLLNGIGQHRARIAILDITGVPVVDSGVADYLNRTIQAARLKGAQTILTGISDAVAEAVVDLGIDWGGVETLRDLQSGLIMALGRLGITLAQRTSNNRQ